jgi:hypothetical protein
MSNLPAAGVSPKPSPKQRPIVFLRDRRLTFFDPLQPGPSLEMNLFPALWAGRGSWLARTALGNLDFRMAFRADKDHRRFPDTFAA